MNGWMNEIRNFGKSYQNKSCHKMNVYLLTCRWKNWKDEMIIFFLLGLMYISVNKSKTSFVWEWMNGWNKSVSDRENTWKRNALGCFSAHSIEDRGFDTLNALSSRNIFLSSILPSFLTFSFNVPSFYSYSLLWIVGSPFSPVFVHTTFYLHAKIQSSLKIFFFPK